MVTNECINSFNPILSYMWVWNGPFFFKQLFLWVSTWVALSLLTVYFIYMSHRQETTGTIPAYSLHMHECANAQSQNSTLSAHTVRNKQQRYFSINPNNLHDFHAQAHAYLLSMCMNSCVCTQNRKQKCMHQCIIRHTRPTSLFIFKMNPMKLSRSPI